MPKNDGVFMNIAAISEAVRTVQKLSDKSSASSTHSNADVRAIADAPRPPAPSELPQWNKLLLSGDSDDEGTGRSHAGMFGTKKRKITNESTEEGDDPKASSNVKDFVSQLQQRQKKRGLDVGPFAAKSSADTLSPPSSAPRLDDNCEAPVAPASAPVQGGRSLGDLTLHICALEAGSKGGGILAVDVKARLKDFGEGDQSDAKEAPWSAIGTKGKALAAKTKVSDPPAYKTALDVMQSLSTHGKEIIRQVIYMRKIDEKKKVKDINGTDWDKYQAGIRFFRDLQIQPALIIIKRAHSLLIKNIVDNKRTADVRQGVSMFIKTDILFLSISDILQSGVDDVDVHSMQQESMENVLKFSIQNGQSKEETLMLANALPDDEMDNEAKNRIRIVKTLCDPESADSDELKLALTAAKTQSDGCLFAVRYFETGHKIKREAASVSCSQLTGSLVSLRVSKLVDDIAQQEQVDAAVGPYHATAVAWHDLSNRHDQSLAQLGAAMQEQHKAALADVVVRLSAAGDRVLFTLKGGIATIFHAITTCGETDDIVGETKAYDNASDELAKLDDSVVLAGKLLGTHAGDSLKTQMGYMTALVKAAKLFHLRRTSADPPSAVDLAENWTLASGILEAGDAGKCDLRGTYTEPLKAVVSSERAICTTLLQATCKDTATTCSNTLMKTLGITSVNSVGDILDQTKPDQLTTALKQFPGLCMPAAVQHHAALQKCADDIGTIVSMNKSLVTADALNEVLGRMKIHKPLDRMLALLLSVSKMLPERIYIV